MTEDEMFEQSMKRPSSYFKFSHEHQWYIDEQLGILDWKGDNMTDEQYQRFKDHYD